MTPDRSDVPGSARVRSALLWGMVGALSFLVLHQAYLFAGGRYFGIAPVILVGVAVGAGVTAAAYALEGRLAARRRRK